jgi:hypothetical protein
MQTLPVPRTDQELREHLRDVHGLGGDWGNTGRDLLVESHEQEHLNPAAEHHAGHRHP